MFPRPHEEKIIFLEFLGFGTQIKGGQNMISIATKEMLKFGYKLGLGLGAVGCGSPALIELLDNKGRLGLGYKPTFEELFQASRGKKMKCDTSAMFIAHIRTTFLASTEVIMPKLFKELEDEEPNMACFIRLYPEEFSMNAIISPEDNPTSTIRPGMLGETVGLWTIKTCFGVVSAE